MAPRPESLVLYAAAALLASSVTVAWAQAPKASGPKIYCWKNAKGQTECGDQPPANAPGDVRELSKRGITVETKPPPPTAEQKKVQEEEAARKKAEQERLVQQKLADKIMLDTYNSVDEIELQRKREVGLLESRIASLQTTIRNGNERLADLQRRSDDLARNKRTVPQNLKDEMAQIDQERLQQYNQVARYKDQIAATNKEFDVKVARYREIKGTTPAAPAAPAKK